MTPGLADWLASRLPRTGIAPVALPNGRVLRLDGRDFPDATTTRSYWLGLGHYEPAVLPVFSALVGDSEVVVDVGANVGVFTLLASAVNPAARVVAFEPVADVFSVLRRNVALNSANRTLCVQAAVSDTNGTVPIFSPANHVSTIASSDIEHRVTWTPGPWQCDYVSTVVLDDFVTAHMNSDVHLLKIDVEGAEDRVLAGARQLIKTGRPHLFCELLETPSGQRAASILEEFRESLGYYAYVLTAIGPIPAEEVRPGAHWNHLLTTLDPRQLEARLPH